MNNNKDMHEFIDSIYEHSEITIADIDHGVTAVAAKLPNGHVIADVITPLEKQRYCGMDIEEIALCKLDDKMWELEMYIIHDIAYDDMIDEELAKQYGVRFCDGVVEEIECDCPCMACDMCEYDEDDDSCYRVTVFEDYNPMDDIEELEAIVKKWFH